MAPRPQLPTGLVAGQSGVIAWLEELNDWHNTETVWKIPAGATRAQAQAVVDDAEAAYLGVDGGGGVVLLAPGRYDWTGTLLIQQTGISIIGANSAACVIYHTGAGACIKWANSPTTVQQQGRLKGFTILGDATAGAKGIHFYDTGTCPAIDDVVVYGFTGPGAVGLHAENVAIQNERANFNRLHLDHNKIGLRITGPSSGAISFGYWRVTDLRLGVLTGSIGIQIDGGALVYNGVWNVICNGGGGTSTGIKVMNTAIFNASIMNFTAEALGTGADVASTATFNPNGMWLPQCADVGDMEFGVGQNSVGQIVSGVDLPPSIVIGAFSGAGAPAAVVKGNVMDGIVTFGSGTSPSAGAILTMIYGWPWVPMPGGKPPIITITPANRATAALRPYVDLLGQTGCVIGTDVAMAASQASTTYSFTYHVLG